MSRLACLCLAFLAGPAAAGSVSNATSNPPTGKYRMWFTKTYGDDHICLTEMEFYDANEARLNASFVSISSCYGCAACANCTHRYGNPNALFDMDATSDSPTAWSCTAPGTFVGGVGSQQVVFTLNGEPKTYILQRPQINGDWVTRDFSLEQELGDGQWQIIDNAVDEVKRPDQWRNITGLPTLVMPPAGVPNPPWSYETPDAWVNDYASCGGSQQSPIDLDLISNMGTSGDAKLPYSYQPLSGRALANTGSTLQLAGKFGNLTLPDGVYAASQFHFHFPPEHSIGGDEHLAIGELQIVHQKVGSRGTDGLAIVSILLHLPLEHDQLKAQEQWFIDIGMLAIPPVGEYTQPLTKPVDLSSALADQLNGNFWQYTGSLATPPCTEGVKWFVMENYALISGVVVQQFKAMFPDPSNSRPVQKLNGRVVSVNTLPGAEAVAAA